MNTQAIKSLRRCLRKLEGDVRECRRMAAVASHGRDFWVTREGALSEAIGVLQEEILRLKSGNIKTKSSTGVK